MVARLVDARPSRLTGHRGKERAFLRRTAPLAFAFAAIATLGFATAHCGGEVVPDEDQAGPSVGGPTTELFREDDDGLPIEVVLTVDWEGSALTEANTAAIERFRGRFPRAKLTHFLNPAYYTKPAADLPTLNARTRRVVARGDELGLHVHGWRSLVDDSGVPSLTSPTFVGVDQPPQPPCGGQGDCGYDVILTAYSTAELRGIIHTSLDILEGQGFGRPTSFRAGGWVGGPRLFEALAAEGISRDHSAVNVDSLRHLFPTYLVNLLDQQWAGIDGTSQPFVVQAPSGGQLLEIPSNGTLADYVTAAAYLKVFEACAKRKLAAPNERVVLSLGFHHETAEARLPVLTEALENMQRNERALGVRLRSVVGAEISN
jgi:hypothetical protein